MTRRFKTRSEYRTQMRLVVSVVQTGVAAMVALYLIGLLRLDDSGWSEFWIAIGIYAVAFTVLNEFLQARNDAALVDALDAEQAGQLDDARLRAGFACAMALPVRTFLLALFSWSLAASFIPLWMAWRLEGLAWWIATVIGSAGVTGGFLSCIAVYFLVKRMLGPLRDDWAARIDDPAERAALVLRVPLSVKLGVATSSVVVVTVFFVVLLAYSGTRAPVDAFVARTQQHLLAMTRDQLEATDAPEAGSALGPARALGLALGVAEHLLVLDIATGETIDGDPSVLSSFERGVIRRSEGSGDTVGGESNQMLAWVRLAGGPDRVLVAVLPAAELDAGLEGQRFRFALLFGVALLVALAIAWLLANDVSRSTGALRLHASAIAAGDLRSSGVLESEDELGDLGRDFQRMGRSLRDTLRRVAATAERVDAAAREIALVGGSVAQASTEQLGAIEQATHQVAAIDRQVSGITSSAQVLTGNVEEAGSSILELGAAAEELNHTASALSSHTEDVSGSIEQTIRSVRQIGENTEGLSTEASDTASSMQQMAASMTEVDGIAGETAALARRVFELAETGRDRVRQTISGMEEIRDATDFASQVTAGLGARAKEIGAIVDVIDDVADETNLLALNAAIIAAQAGEGGRAFSVVADEIKELADRVMSSTKEIGGLIRAVQSESANASAAIEKGTESVQTGVDLSAEAGLALEEITAAARSTGERIQGIVSSVREQARATTHVTGLMANVSGRVDELRAASTEQERGNEVVMRGVTMMRDVAQQTHRTTEEQSRGVRSIRDSIDSVRDAVDGIHGALQGQSEACRAAVDFLQQVHEQTDANHKSAAQMRLGTQALSEVAEALREDVRRFRV